MLHGEDWYMVRDLLRTGASVSEVARRTGYDRKTIRKLRDAASPPPPLRRTRPQALDPFKPYLRERAERGVLNATKLFGEIQRQGYGGGVAQVRRFLQPLRPATAAPVTERFETPPGQQAQVDWAHCGHLWEQEQRRPLSAFVLTLGYSRRQYVEFTVSQDLETFLRCHVHAFTYFGGIPAELLYDNLKTAVAGRSPDGRVHWNARFADFADWYGFSPRACQPYRAQTKGKVERGIRYLRGNFLLGLDLREARLEPLNREVLAWLHETADLRVHGTTQVRPVDRWPAEQAALHALGQRPAYDTSYISQRQVSREGFVAYKGCRYAVPPEQAGQVLLLREGEDGRLRLYRGTACVADHPLGERGQVRTLPGHAAAVRRLAQRRAAAPVPSLPQPAPPADWPVVERRPLARYDELTGVAEGGQ